MNTFPKWEAWIGGKANYCVTGPAAASALTARWALEKDPFAKGLFVEIASKSKEQPAIAFGDTPESAINNARLIAAAPDLLKSLLDMVSAMESYGYHHSPEIITARAAIAKATGEST